MNAANLVDPNSRALIFDALLESLCADGKVTAREADAAVGAASALALTLAESVVAAPPWEAGLARSTEHAELERSLAVATAAWGALIDGDEGAHATATVERIASNMGVGRNRMRALVDLARRVRGSSAGRVPFRHEFNLLVLCVARRFAAHGRTRLAHADE